MFVFVCLVTRGERETERKTERQRFKDLCTVNQRLFLEKVQRDFCFLSSLLIK